MSIASEKSGGSAQRVWPNSHTLSVPTPATSLSSILKSPLLFCSSSKSLLVVLQKSRSCLPKKFGPLQLDPSESLSYKRKQIKEPNQKHFTYTAEEKKLVEGIFRAALPEREFVRGRRAEAPSDTQQPVSNSGAAAFLHAVAEAARCAIPASDST